ncbi:MAG TPA: OmpA family protein, partial [Kofleriaceae bacterium]|nr:OmpA family protein [Kofleriaceae bacterium]
RAAPRAPARTAGVAITAGTALALALAPAAASADDLALSVFDPVPATASDGFQLQSPDVGKSGDWALSAVVSHATDPLILDGIANGVFLDDYAVISRSTVTNLGGAIAFLGRFEAGARIPLYVQEGQPPGNPIEEFTGQPAEGNARGDLALHAKARLVRRRLAGDGAFLVGLGAQLTLPTATAGRFAGAEDPSGRVQILGSLVPGAFERRITLTMNLGGVLRTRSTYANLEQKSGAAWGLGLAVRALDNVWLAGEVYGDTVPAGRTDEMTRSQVLSPIEWLAGLRWKPDHRFTVGLAAGRGLTSAIGTPAFRGVLALTLTPGAPELRPIRIPKPDGDADGDGVRDSVDRCPDEPEDLDLFDDTDGCPDPDNDGDGIPDALDRCPIEAEDVDGFEDADGCVDKDNDGDGIPDALDKCPMEAEDADLFDDTDGCPDPDNDRDGILDAADKCPTSPETINGKDDNDGCPDKGDSLVVLSPDRLELLDLIQFTAAQKIAKASQNLLAQVGATMRARTEIVRLRITVHVQPTDDPDRDQALSDQRATAVREWLVQWGVAPERLEARGFGGTRPLVPADRKGAAALNQRVELIILERK